LDDHVLFSCRSLLTLKPKERCCNGSVTWPKYVKRSSTKSCRLIINRRASDAKRWYKYNFIFFQKKMHCTWFSVEWWTEKKRMIYSKSDCILTLLFRYPIGCNAVSFFQLDTALMEIKPLCLAMTLSRCLYCPVSISRTALRCAQGQILIRIRHSGDDDSTITISRNG
jgi:hypothetical protein